MSSYKRRRKTKSQDNELVMNRATVTLVLMRSMMNKKNFCYGQQLLDFYKF